MAHILSTISEKMKAYAGHIRIYHECEGRIEKSVTRIAVWHHEACRVMTNGGPEGRIFLSYPNTNNGFCFLLITVFIHHFILFIYFKISLQKSLNTLRCKFHMMTLLDVVGRKIAYR